MNNQRGRFRDNNKGLPVARHSNKQDHSIFDLECAILKGHFANSTDRLIEEQTLISKLKTDSDGLSHDLDFVTPYCHNWYTSFSINSPMTVWQIRAYIGHSYFTQQRSFVNFIWHRTTDDDRRSGRQLWTLYKFYWIKVSWNQCFTV